MTFGQVRALCDGIDVLTRADEARQIGTMRLAMWGEADDVEKHMAGLAPQGGPDPVDAILAQYQGGE